MPADDFYRKLLDHVHDGVYFVDPQRRILYWNRAAERLSGFSAREVVGSHCFDNILIHIDDQGRELCKGPCPLAQTLEDGRPREAWVYMHHKQGHRIPVHVRVSPVRDQRGRIQGAVELFADASAWLAVRQRLEELERLALVDELTGLPNRRYLEQELYSRLGELARYDRPCGVMFLDVDGFKRLNDTYGHQVGDRVLRMVASTLARNSRSFDVWGRWGGDEFLGIFPLLESVALTRLAERYRILVKGAVLFHQGEPLRVAISLGVTMIHRGEKGERAVARADRLMYRAKAAGGDQVRFSP